MQGGVPIAGGCDARFERVREAFQRNFEELGEIGAAVCVYVGGRKVVDLWGGWARVARVEPWQQDMLVNVFSVGKGVAVLGVLACVERGWVELDWPIARYWPEFGQGGKGGITLRQLLSHRAGVPAIREAMPLGAALDIRRMLGALERQEPWWVPGDGHGYHVNTFGYLVGECVRRVSGRSLGAILSEYVCKPVEADVYLGLPESEHGRVAEFDFPLGRRPVGGESPTGAELMRVHAYANPPDLSGAGVVNTREWRLAELPSTNMHASARGVARIYAALAGGGARIVDSALLREATREHSNGVDLVLERPSRFALGFQLTQPERPLGPNAGAFGHHGAGGSLGFCDPEAELAFGYVMNDLGPRWQNPRNRALIDSVYGCLES